MPGPLLPRPSTTRRAALGGLVASALVLSGCDRDDLLPPDADPAPDPSNPAVDADPDQALVDEVVQKISAVWLVVTSTRAYPVLRQVLGPLQRLHEAHLDVLDAPPDQPPVPMTGGAADRYREVRRIEEALARRLSAASVAADSGALAKLLASMSAAVAQRLAAMPETIGTSDGGPR